MPMLRFSGGRLVTSLSLNQTRPDVASSKPEMILRIVVLPEPEGPTSAVQAEPGHTSDTEPNATVPSGYTLFRFSRRIS
jgi:hypothetical protein